MKKIILLIFCFLFVHCAFANNVSITNLTKSSNTITFDISWENSWRSTFDFHDAVWVFIKQAPNGGPSWIHANINTATTGTGYQTHIPSDEIGFFVRRSSNGNGTATTNVTVNLSNLMGTFQDIKVSGIEMVYVPEESFYLGDGHSQLTFHRGDDTLASYEVTSEALMTYGSTINDFKGANITQDIPANFPKGFAAFYCMKYTMTQGQYVDFLNSLDRLAQNTRTETDLSGTATDTTYVMSGSIYRSFANGIRCPTEIGTGNIIFYCDYDGDNIPNETNDGQSKVCNYLSPHDFMAYLDWSGLAPMTILEYEKACRGPLPSVPYELAWGSTLTTTAGTLLNEGEPDEKYSNSGIDGGIKFGSGTAIRVGLNAPSTNATRELSNASYYGIPELSNRFGVSCMGPNYAYIGEVGDGILNSIGNANFINVVSVFYPKTSFFNNIIESGNVSSYNGTTAYNNQRTQFKSSRGIRRI